MAKEVKKSKKDVKNKRHFFKDFKAELKKVIWPTPKQLINNTIAVVSIVVITAVIVFVLDIAFESLNTYGINRLRSAIESTESQNEENTSIDQSENVVEESNQENTSAE